MGRSKLSDESTGLSVGRTRIRVQLLQRLSGLVVRAQDRQLRGPGFESNCCSFKTWAISFTPHCLCLSEETPLAVGPIYLVSMPVAVKYPTQGNGRKYITDSQSHWSQSMKNTFPLVLQQQIVASRDAKLLFLSLNQYISSGR